LSLLRVRQRDWARSIAPALQNRIRLAEPAFSKLDLAIMPCLAGVGFETGAAERTGPVVVV